MTDCVPVSIRWVILEARTISKAFQTPRSIGNRVVFVQPTTPRPVSAPTRVSTSRWNSPRLEIGVGAVLLAFFAFVQAVNVYDYLIGAVDFPVIGLTVFFILWGIGLIVHGVLRRRRADQRPPFPGHAALSQVVSGAPGSQLMACPRCGATVNAANRFCPNCRFQLRQ